MSKKKYLYVVGLVEREAKINIPDSDITVPIKWADGMVGCLPCFSTVDAAQKYAPHANILTITMTSKEPTP